MTTLYSLAERLRVGDTLQVASTTADVDVQKPKTVTRIDAQEEKIRVETEGPKGGNYAFRVDSDGNNKMVYLSPEEGKQELGRVKVARLAWPGNQTISL